MANAANTSALIALFLGLYYLGVGIGGLGNPGLWSTLVEELEGSPYNQLLGGALALVLGAVLVALVPPRGDWLNLVLFAFGCIAVLEGFVFLVWPGAMLRWSRLIVTGSPQAFALLTLALGAGFTLVGLARLLSIASQ